MNLTVRKPSFSGLRGSIAPAAASGHLWRSGGLGDLIFMEPAVRKLKAIYPQTRLVLHAPAAYECLSPLLGFDGFEANAEGRCVGIGLDLHWGPETHAGWYCLDRVSISEDLIGVPIGDESVVLDVPKGQSLLREVARIIPEKPFLAFLPFAAAGTGLSSRSLPGKQIVALIEALSAEYTVVMLHHGPLPELVKRTSAVCFENTTMEQFLATVADCEKCLAVDSGGLYVAAAAGVPSVGIYDHVAPWLRAKRFPNIYSLYLRRPTCECRQHEDCTCPEKGEAPCKFFDPEMAIEALSLVDIAGERVWSIFGDRSVAEPEVSVRIFGNGDGRATSFSIAHALAGIPWHYGDPDDGSAFSLGVKAGDLISRKDALKSLSDLSEPGFKNLDLPIDMRKHDRP
jgi:hypothetical protein